MSPLWSGSGSIARAPSLKVSRSSGTAEVSKLSPFQISVNAPSATAIEASLTPSPFRSSPTAKVPSLRTASISARTP